MCFLGRELIIQNFPGHVAFGYRQLICNREFGKEEVVLGKKPKVLQAILNPGKGFNRPLIKTFMPLSCNRRNRVVTEPVRIPSFLFMTT